MAYRIKILLPLPMISAALDYYSEEEYPQGSFVQVPFGRGKYIGIVWHGAIDKDLALNKLKYIIKKFECPPMPMPTMQLIEFMAGYYIQPLGAILKLSLVLPEYFNKMPNPPAIPNYFIEGISSIKTEQDQDTAIATINANITKHQFCVHSLEGITGSGKTLVFLHAIRHAWQMGRNVMVLVPEIALTHNFIRQFKDFFGAEPPVWHSDIAVSLKKKYFGQIIFKQTPIVFGARSAMSLPLDNIGLIILDEEHDIHYKQNQGLRYYARDMAIKLAQYHQASVVLASATPSMETKMNALSKIFVECVLKSRINQANLPKISIIDMKKYTLAKDNFLSPPMIDAISAVLAKGKQALVFLNKRGYAPLYLCQKCGFKVECTACDSFLTHHKSPNRLECGVCAAKYPIPLSCSACGADDSMMAFGPGIEKIAEECQSRYPNARIAVVSSDNINDDEDWSELIAKILKHEIDIIVGTQLLAKGHHFPNLNFVGIVSADSLFCNPDPRALERAFQLLQQVIGRAGRMGDESDALIQSYSPQEPLLLDLANQRIQNFYIGELHRRERGELPPFARMASIIISGKNEKNTMKFAQNLGALAPKIDGFQLLGPAQAPIYKIRHNFRLRFLLKCPKKLRVQNFIYDWINNCPFDWRAVNGIKIEIDIDPQDFY